MNQSTAPPRCSTSAGLSRPWPNPHLLLDHLLAIYSTSILFRHRYLHLPWHRQHKQQPRERSLVDHFCGTTTACLPPNRPAALHHQLNQRSIQTRNTASCSLQPSNLIRRAQLQNQHTQYLAYSSRKLRCYLRFANSMVNGNRLCTTTTMNSSLRARRSRR